MRINWGLHICLQDIDDADDFYLLAHTFSDMQTKLDRLIQEARHVGLEINVSKIKSMRLGNTGTAYLNRGDIDIEDKEVFCYLSSVQGWRTFFFFFF